MSSLYRLHEDKFVCKNAKQLCFLLKMWKERSSCHMPISLQPSVEVLYHRVRDFAMGN